MLLCDHAAVAEGKLYINGAGWTSVRANHPASMALAVLVRVGWHQANIRHQVVLQLMTEDGRAALNPEGKPWRAQGTLEVGRPPGVRHGTPLPAPMAVVLPAVPLLPGRYRWEVVVNNDLLSSAEFDAVSEIPIRS